MSNAYAIITDIPAKIYEVKNMKHKRPAYKIKFIKRTDKGFTKRIRRRELYDLEPTPELREAMRQADEIIAAWEKLHEEHSYD